MNLCLKMSSECVHLERTESDSRTFGLLHGIIPKVSIVEPENINYE